MECKRIDANLQLAMKGDAQAFQQIYELNKRRIFNLCFRMIHNHTLAEDLTQDVFLQLFRRIHTFRGEAAFSTWLHRMAINVVLMNIRSDRSALFSSLDAMTDEDGTDHVPNEFGAQDLRLFHATDRIQLVQGLEKLPAGYRIVFVLHDIEGYEHSEIAEILGCSVGNCKSQLHKARLKLRKAVLGQDKKRYERRKPIVNPVVLRELDLRCAA